MSKFKISFTVTYHAMMRPPRLERVTSVKFKITRSIKYNRAISQFLAVKMVFKLSPDLCAFSISSKMLLFLLSKISLAMLSLFGGSHVPNHTIKAVMSFYRQYFL